MARPEPIDPATLRAAVKVATDQGMPPAGAAWIALHRLLITPRTPQ